MDFGGQMMWIGSLLPEVSRAETQGVTIAENTAGIKPGPYIFMELYCTDDTCDCQRAMIRVLDCEGQLYATLSYGWRNLKFYVEWMHGDVETASTIPGINLYTLQPQSGTADAFLTVFRELLKDQSVAKQYPQHYSEFKAAIRRASQPKTLTQAELADQRKLRRRLNLKAKSVVAKGRLLLPAPGS